MRILVYDTATSSGGALVIVKSFYNWVCNNDKKNEYIFLISSNYLNEQENIKIVVNKSLKTSKIKRMYYELFKGQEIVNRYQPDVIFSLQNTCFRKIDVKQVLYVHQSIPFQSAKKFHFLAKGETDYAIYQYVIGYFIKKSIELADYTIVQTEWMRKAVLEKTNIDKDRIVKIAPSMSSDCYFSDNDWDNLEFFYPTSNSIYKNIDLLNEAIRALNESGLNEFNVSITLNEDDNKSNFDCIGQISHKEVLERLSTSTLIFPSYIETFGLPLLEAKMCGTVILASDCPFSHEILDGYDNAYFFDPFNKVELIELMKKVINGEIKRKKLDKNEKVINKKQTSTWREVHDLFNE